jgi:hypothetical protein
VSNPVVILRDPFPEAVTHRGSWRWCPETGRPDYAVGDGSDHEVGTSAGDRVRPESLRSPGEGVLMLEVTAKP